MIKDLVFNIVLIAVSITIYHNFFVKNGVSLSEKKIPTFYVLDIDKFEEKAQNKALTEQLLNPQKLVDVNAIWSQYKVILFEKINSLKEPNVIVLNKSSVIGGDIPELNLE